MKVFTLLFSLLFVGMMLCFPNKVSANNYKIKPVLFITGSSHPSETQINQHKEGIIQALEEVQQWYAQRLDGHTFDFDPTVEVVQGTLREGVSPNFSTQDLSRYLFNYKGGELLPLEIGTIYAVWIVGSGDIVSEATSQLPCRLGCHISDRGYALYSDRILHDLSNNVRNRPRRDDNALSTIAHELGHTFGLVDTGFALVHTCSLSSIGECKNEAPLPLPKADECYRDVMCPPSTAPFQEMGLNNSIHNDEINKIYKSPFINPQNDSPPGSHNQSQIENISPNPIIAGDVFTITGSGFGDKKGEVVLNYPTNNENNPLTYGITLRDYILDWSNSEIKLEVPKGFVTQMIQYLTARYSGLKEKYSTNQFKLFVVPYLGAKSQTVVTFEDSEIFRPTITINYSATCGAQRQPFYRSVTLSSKPPPRSIGDKIYIGNGDSSGQGSFVYTVDPFNDDLTFYVDADKVYHPSDSSKDINPQPAYYTITLDNFNQSVEKDVSFYYPRCPDDITNSCSLKPGSAEYDCSNGQRCFNDYDVDQNTCALIPRINTEGEYAGKHFHCDPDPTCSGPQRVAANISILSLECDEKQGETCSVASAITDSEGVSIANHGQYDETFALESSEDNSLSSKVISTAFAKYKPTKLGQVDKLPEEPCSQQNCEITIPCEIQVGKYSLSVYLTRKGSDEILASDSYPVDVSSSTLCNVDKNPPDISPDNTSSKIPSGYSPIPYTRQTKRITSPSTDIPASPLAYTPNEKVPGGCEVGTPIADCSLFCGEEQDPTHTCFGHQYCVYGGTQNNTDNIASSCQCETRELSCQNPTQEGIAPPQPSDHSTFSCSAQDAFNGSLTQLCWVDNCNGIQYSEYAGSSSQGIYQCTWSNCTNLVCFEDPGTEQQESSPPPQEEQPTETPQGGADQE